jgi:hypothetical protein
LGALADLDDATVERVEILGEPAGRESKLRSRLLRTEVLQAIETRRTARRADDAPSRWCGERVRYSGAAPR